MWSEMQTALFRAWTWVADFISNDDDCYIKQIFSDWLVGFTVYQPYSSHLTPN